MVFRHETSVKYPTFTPVPASDQSASRLSEAFSPIPIRSHYPHQDPHAQGFNPPDSLANHVYGLPRGPAPGPFPGTPAPTPPPSPKPKKQQYQTDQSRPFLFPFSSKMSLRNQKLVPFAIDEADRLYERHMYVSAALWQMAKTREECILDESGLNSLPSKSEGFSSWSQDRRYSVVSTIGNGDEGEKLCDIALLDQKLAEAEANIKKTQLSEDRGRLRKAQERKQDLIRLKRVENIYVTDLSLYMVGTVYSSHIGCDTTCHARLCASPLEAFAGVSSRGFRTATSFRDVQQWIS